MNTIEQPPKSKVENDPKEKIREELSEMFKTLELSPAVQSRNKLEDIIAKAREEKADHQVLSGLIGMQLEMQKHPDVSLYEKLQSYAKFL